MSRTNSPSNKIARLAADQNPDRAVALLQAALKKGITGEALSLLKKISEKDAAAASSLAADVVGQLMKKSLINGNQVDYPGLQTSMMFLTDHLRQRPASDKGFRFAQADMKSLADKLVLFFLDPKNQAAGSYSPQFIPIAEKMRPDAVDKLKELMKTAQVRHGFAQLAPDPEAQRLLEPKTPIEEIIAKAPKLNVDTRRQVYQNTANRLAASGDMARARQILADNFSDDALSNAQESLNWYYAYQLINEGKYSEAEAVIDEFPPNNRFSALLSLASTIYTKNPEENKTRALTTLARAGAGLPTRPETANEMQQTMQLVNSYATMEPGEAFRMLDGLVPQLNELTEAAAVIGGFQGTHSYRHGEMLLVSGNQFGINIDGGMLRNLAQKDFDRTLALINTFIRREMRLALKQQLLESL